jgi:general L-amino acid transport system permease protein
MAAVESARPKAPLLYNPKVRGIAYQALLCIAVLFLAWSAVHNAAENLERARIASGFGFWDNTAGFDISQSLIDYSNTSTYGRAFWVGLLNTLLVAALGIVFATILGFVIGIARLSTNWLVAHVAAFYVAAAIAYRIWAKRRQNATGQQAPVLLVTLAFVIVLPLVVLALSGFPLTFKYPQSGRFNIQGGLEILPEFMALLFGLVLYTAAFIAEVVRAGIRSVAKGQTEAAYSLGLRPGPTLRLVVVPQAMRVIIPPLTSQYLNLTKNSSLAVAIGYPDLVQIFAGTVLNQTGQAVEVIAITMAVYLTISLATSALMNLYNRHIALVER